MKTSLLTFALMVPCVLACTRISSTGSGARGIARADGTETTENAPVATQGNPIDLDLAWMKNELIPKIILAAQTASAECSDPCLDAGNLNEELCRFPHIGVSGAPRNNCNTYLRNVLSALSTTASSSKIQVRTTQNALTAGGSDAFATTELSTMGDITFSLPAMAALNLTRLQILTVMVHELLHKTSYAALNRPVSDTDNLLNGGYANPGAVMLTNAGIYVALQAVSQGLAAVHHLSDTYASSNGAWQIVAGTTVPTFANSGKATHIAAIRAKVGLATPQISVYVVDGQGTLYHGGSYPTGGGVGQIWLPWNAVPNGMGFTDVGSGGATAGAPIDYQAIYVLYNGRMLTNVLHPGGLFVGYADMANASPANITWKQVAGVADYYDSYDTASELLALSQDGTAYANLLTHDPANPCGLSGWCGWRPLPGGTVQGLSRNIVQHPVANSPYSSLEVYALCGTSICANVLDRFANGAFAPNWVNMVNGPWSGWGTVPNNGSFPAGGFVEVGGVAQYSTTNNGLKMVEVFALSTAGKMYSQLLDRSPAHAATGGWRGWVEVPGNTCQLPNGQPAVKPLMHLGQLTQSPYPGNYDELQVFAIDCKSNPVVNILHRDGSDWSGWNELSGLLH